MKLKYYQPAKTGGKIQNIYKKGIFLLIISTLSFYTFSQEIIY